MVQPRRPIRIANVSGCTGDGPLALRRAVREGPVDVITADYLAEANNGKARNSSRMQMPILWIWA